MIQPPNEQKESWTRVKKSEDNDGIDPKNPEWQHESNDTDQIIDTAEPQHDQAPLTTYDCIDKPQHESETLDYKSTFEQLQVLKNILTEETNRRETAERDLKESQELIKNTDKRWKSTANQLNKLRAQNQGGCQVTESYLIDLTMQLRYNIKNFAIQYFDSGRLIRTTSQDNYMPHTGGSIEHHVMVQAYLWNFLGGEIFDQFHWAGSRRSSLKSLCDFLRPGSLSNSEENRKYNMWRATTVRLLLDVLNREEVSKEYKSKLHRLDNHFYNTLNPKLTKAGAESWFQQLHGIFEAALQLDREISRQAAQVSWDFSSGTNEITTDTMSMVSQNEGHATQIVHTESVVVAPALMKRGKSTGEGFNEEVMLLGMEKVEWEVVLKSRGR